MIRNQAPIEAGAVWDGSGEGSLRVTGSAAVVRLPARLDTLGALALAGPMQALVASGDPVTIDAGAIETIGLIALQLLAALSDQTNRKKTPFSIENISDVAALRIRYAGLSHLLPGQEEANLERPLSMRFSFADSALMFGQEPLDSLAVLATLGASVTAILPEEGTERIFIEADRIWLRFDAHFPIDTSRTDIERYLEVACGECSFEWNDPIKAVVELPPDRGPTVPVLQERLDALLELVGDLIASQASLTEKLGSQQTALTAELIDLDRAVVAVQDGILNIGMAPIDGLLMQLPGADRLRLSHGNPEIERGVFHRIAPGLAALLKALPDKEPVPVEIHREGGLLTLRFDLPAAEAEASRLCDVARNIGGHGDIAGGHMLTLRLPRSLMLVDVMLVEVGAATFAIPVINLVEVLRPAADMLFGLENQQSMLRFQGRFIPILPLGERFATEGWTRDPRDGVLVVVSAASKIVALQADMVSEQRQVMLRPIAGGMAPPRGISGAAIISTSRLALVVNLADLFVA